MSDAMKPLELGFVGIGCLSAQRQAHSVRHIQQVIHVMSSSYPKPSQDIDEYVSNCISLILFALTFSIHTRFFLQSFLPNCMCVMIQYVYCIV